MVPIVRLAKIVSGYAAALVLAAGTMCAQDALPISPQDMPRLGGPQDWSNRHVIYTRNGAAEDMLKLRDDPRFLNTSVLRFMNEHRNPIGQSLTIGPDETDLQESDALAPWKPIDGPPAASKGKNSKVDWSYSMGPTAGMAAGETPAVYTANYSTPSCTNDFVVYSLNATPSVGGQANLVALNNLYSNGAGTGSCTGTGPSLLFAYAIGTGGSPLSPVLSVDGTRVAWIENRTATDAWLHVTVWASSPYGSATWPVGVTNSMVAGQCSGGTPCDFALDYTNAAYSPGCPTAYEAGNNHSDLWVDYTNDVGYISANNGLLYHIKNLFSTTANPSVDFCIPVNTTFEGTPSSAMSGPIYDRINNEVYLTDSEKIYAYTVNSTAPTPNFTLAASYTYGNVASAHNYQTGPGPLLDVFNGYVYVPSTYDAAGKTSITQLPVSLATGVPVELGPRDTNANRILFYGAFDNNYWNYGPKSALSTLYSCGTDTTTTTQQDLFSISFNASTGIVNATPAMSYNKNVNPGGTPGVCSPLTEFFDGTNDRLFVGMGAPGATTGSNVVTMWTINSQLTNTSGSGGTMPTYTAEATGYIGGSSGLAADNNDSGSAQAENIYFSTLDSGSASTAVARTGFNVNGIYSNGTTFATGGYDNDGNAYSSTELGTTVTWNGTTFTYGPTNAVDVWCNTNITLPTGSFNTLEILASAINGNQTGQIFTVNYSDGSNTSFTQDVSDWYTGPVPYSVETVAQTMTYENTSTGGERVHATYVYGYSFALNPAKTVSTLTLPANRDVCVLAAALSANCGGTDFCAVKLTQSGLQ
ncbi:MAG: hypothetical protein ACLQLC_20100 [Candidatus Sulfotelmatobacter sp.]